jgi:hypothetical protein
MLHVLDVARTLRRDSEIVAAELNREELIASLRERLKASAAATGDNVSEAEIDAAIRIYYENLHKYADPPLSGNLVLAHLYVRRRLIMVATTACVLFAGMAWWLFWRDNAPFSTATRERIAIARETEATQTALERFKQRLEITRSLTEDPAALEQILRISRAGAAAESTRNRDELERLTGELGVLEYRLREEYEVLIVTGPDRRSGVDRAFGDQDSGYYLIVEARTADGRILSREITSRETGERRRVTTWGEQVPKSVYGRIARDKQMDGAVDERLFAVKRPGRLNEELRLSGEDGQPLNRGGQIFDW